MRKILDPCCGHKEWLGGNLERFVTMDIKPEVRPDVIGDMRFLPFANCVFDAIRFDPPHLIRDDVKSWNKSYVKYGHWKNRPEWCAALHRVNSEFHRVTELGATLLVKIIHGKDKRVTKRQDLWQLFKWVRSGNMKRRQRHHGVIPQLYGHGSEENKVHSMSKCSLEGYANIDCCTDMDWHHVISFSMARGNPKVRKILKANPPELMAWVCATHNRQRRADGRKARPILLRKRNKETQGKTKETVDSLPWKVKKHSDSFKAMTC